MWFRLQTVNTRGRGVETSSPGVVLSLNIWALAWLAETPCSSSCLCVVC